jgi:cell division protein FtsW
MMALKRTHYRRLQTPAVAFTAVGVTLMLLVTVYFADGRLHRWIRLGSFSLQPSELAKPALVLFLAFFVSMRARAINDRYTLLPAGITVGLVTTLVAIPDLGTAIVLVATAAVVFFVAGLNRRHITEALIVAVLGILLAVVLKPYRLARAVQYIDPDYQIVDMIDPAGHLKAYLQKSLTTKDTRYQAEQSRIAVGTGGIFGLGLMEGKQKLFYLPEAHNDFIYAVVGEEWGFAGSAGVLAAFLVILWRGLRAAVRIPDDFGRYLALGVTATIVFQAFLNMSVVLDMVPTKGIPLPMISSGGSSLLSTLLLSGMLLNVSENAG